MDAAAHCLECSRVENGEQPQLRIYVHGGQHSVAEWRTGNNRNLGRRQPTVYGSVAEWRTGNNRNYTPCTRLLSLSVAEWRTGNNRNFSPMAVLTPSV